MYKFFRRGLLVVFALALVFVASARKLRRSIPPPTILQSDPLPLSAALIDQPLAALAGNLPLRFEANVGQSNSRALYLAHTSGYTLFLTNQGAVMTLAGNPPLPNPPPLSGSPLSANPHPEVVASDELSGKSNYFLGSDPPNGTPTCQTMRGSAIRTSIRALTLPTMATTARWNTISSPSPHYSPPSI